MKTDLDNLEQYPKRFRKLRPGTVVKINGVPIKLSVETIAETHPDNWDLIDALQN